MNNTDTPKRIYQNNFDTYSPSSYLIFLSSFSYFITRGATIYSLSWTILFVYDGDAAALGDNCLFAFESLLSWFEGFFTLSPI